jgi:hypothetical protein
VQLNARLTSELELVLQGVGKYSDDGDHVPQLTWGFLSYTPDPELRLRAGRLGWDVYLMADSRDIGYSYTWVRPPADYFGKLLVAYFDGADLVYRRPLFGGLASAKVYGGRIAQDVPTGGGQELGLSGSVIAGGNLTWRRGDWSFRLGYAHTSIEGDLPNFQPLQDALRATALPAAAAIADDLGLDGRVVHDFSAGGAWEHGPWQAQLMYNRLWSSSLALATTNSAYLFLGYRTGNWNPYLSLSGTRTDGVERTTGLPRPNPLDTAVALALDSAQAIQHTFSVGLRYDFATHADVKLQLDRIHVYDGATGLWTGAEPDWDGDATLFTVTVDFVF